jgi:regulator of cell morphogenesis and NO signaling
MTHTQNQSNIGNPAELPPDRLARYIVETHHTFLNRELPRLREMAERVIDAHGAGAPSLDRLLQVYVGLEEELHSHMMKEERILFPAVAALVSGQSGPLPLDGPIACMIHEHSGATNALDELRRLSNYFQPPAGACNTYRALFAGLRELDADLRHHIHLENDILFPAAEQLTRS